MEVTEAACPFPPLTHILRDDRETLRQALHRCHEELAEDCCGIPSSQLDAAYTYVVAVSVGKLSRSPRSKGLRKPSWSTARLGRNSQCSASSPRCGRRQDSLSASTPSGPWPGKRTSLQDRQSEDPPRTPPAHPRRGQPARRYRARTRRVYRRPGARHGWSVRAGLSVVPKDAPGPQRQLGSHRTLR